jgi:NAD(P)-dependent dehydrogenase (short-subunit alcohol dehydrogenase family)
MYTVDFTGKVVVVIGAGTGIGAAIACGFNEAGADLAISYQSSKEGAEQVAAEVRAAGHRCLLLAANARRIADVEAVVDETVATFGAIDVLVYNAGLTEPCPLFDLTEEEWDRTHDVNLKSMFFCARRAATHMRAQKRGGSIVLISSVHSIQAFRGHTHYAASKAAINMMTRSLAEQLAPLGIRVNAIAPGSIDVRSGPAAEQPYPADLGKYIPLGRVGRPSEMADIAVFLASERASYIVGSVLFADGGLTLPMHLPG